MAGGNQIMFDDDKRKARLLKKLESKSLEELEFITYITSNKYKRLLFKAIHARLCTSTKSQNEHNAAVILMHKIPK